MVSVLVMLGFLFRFLRCHTTDTHRVLRFPRQRLPQTLVEDLNQAVHGAVAVVDLATSSAMAVIWNIVRLAVKLSRRLSTAFSAAMSFGDKSHVGEPLAI